MDDYNVAEISLDTFKKLFKDSQYMSPEEYTFWKAYQSRTFFIDYELDETYSVVEMCKMILQMNADEMNIPTEELKPIKIYIHSFGGDSFQGHMVMDVIMSSRIPIITIALGTAMSSGFDIFLAGHRRYMFRHSQLMLHAGYLGGSGTASEMEELTKNNKRRLEEDKQYVLSRTTMGEKIYNRNKNKDWYLTPEECEQYGIAKIINSLEDIQ